MTNTTFDFTSVACNPIPERTKVDSQEVLGATTYLANMPAGHEAVFPTRLLRVLQKAKENVLTQDTSRKYALSYVKEGEERRVRARRVA
jgi:hypothetical protein